MEPDSSLDPLPPALESLLQRFETAWREGAQPPRIEAFLPDNEQDRRRVLPELVCLDLEFRLQAGESIRVEDYTRRFPSLDAALLERITVEFPCPYCGRTFRELPIEHIVCPHCTGRFRRELRQPVGEFDDTLRVSPPAFLARTESFAATRVTSSPDQPHWDTDTQRFISTDPNLAPHGMLGRYRLLEIAGQGAFGRVYRAHDTTLNRQVAIKVPVREFHSAEDAEKFVGEASKAAHLTHPGIVPVFGVESEQGQPFIVSEFVEGVTLAQWNTKRRFNSRDAARLVAVLADILDHAHERGVVHRDLKPGNILLQGVPRGDRSPPAANAATIQDNNSGNPAGSVSTPSAPSRSRFRLAQKPTSATATPRSSSRFSGLTMRVADEATAPHDNTEFQPRVMDFGLARRDTEEQVVMTADNLVLGTPAYMSPEQARGKSHEADRRADVYSLGVILFELLVGVRPFVGGTIQVLLNQIIGVEPPSICKFNPALSRDLETICFKCLEKSPDKRFQSAAELRDELLRFLDGEPILSRPISRSERAWRWCKRHPHVAIPTAVIAVVFLTAFTLVTWSWRSERAAHRETARSRAETLAHFRQARETVDASYTGVGELLQYYPMPHVRERLLARAAADYDRFATLHSDDLDLEIERGRAWLRLGDVHRALGQLAKAAADYRGAAGHFERLRNRRLSDSRLADCRAEWADAQARLGVVLADKQQIDAALSALRAAVKELDELAVASPTHQRTREVLAAALLDQGALLLESGRVSDAEPLLRRAAAEYDRLTSVAPSPPLRAKQAPAHAALGKLLATLGRHREALTEYDLAIHVFDDLTAAEPDHPGHVDARADVRIFWASSLRALGDIVREENIYREAIQDYELLNKALPDVPKFIASRSLTRVDLGQLLHQAGRNPEALDALRAAHADYETLTASYPETLVYREAWAACRDMLGKVLLDVGQFDASQAEHEAALGLLKSLIDESLDRSLVPKFIERRALARSHLAQTLHARGDDSAAESQFRAAVGELTQLLEQHPDEPAIRNELAHALSVAGDFQFDLGDTDAARASFDAALRQWRTLSEKSPTPESLNAFAEFLVRCPDRQHRDPSQASILAARACREAPTNPDYVATYAAAALRTGELDQARDRLAAARRIRGHSTDRELYDLSLAHHCANEQAAAQQAFQDGRAWQEKHRPTNRVSQRLANEITTSLESKGNSK